MRLVSYIKLDSVAAAAARVVCLHLQFYLAIPLSLMCVCQRILKIKIGTETLSSKWK